MLLSVFFAVQSASAQTPQKHHYPKEPYVPIVEPKLNNSTTSKPNEKKQSKVDKAQASPNSGLKAENKLDQRIIDYNASLKAQTEGIAYYEKHDWLKAFRKFKLALENRPADGNSKYAMEKAIEKLRTSGGAYSQKIKDEIRNAQAIKDVYICPENIKYCASHVADSKFCYSLFRRLLCALSMYDIDEKKLFNLKYELATLPKKDSLAICKSSGDKTQDAKVLEAFELAMPFMRSFWQDISSMEIALKYIKEPNPPLRTPEFTALEKCKDRCLTLFKRGKQESEQKNFRKAIIDLEAAHTCAMPAFRDLVEQHLADCYYFYALKIEDTNPKLAHEYLDKVKKFQPERLISY